MIDSFLNELKGASHEQSTGYLDEDIRCDVDENLWPNRQEREEAEDHD